MLRKTFYSTLSILTFVFGLRYWWGNWAKSMFTNGSVTKVSIAIFILVAIILISYSFFYVSRLIIFKKNYLIKGIPVSSLLMYFFAAIGSFLNLYFSANLVISHLQNSHHSLANWAYPLIPFLAFALLILLPLTPIVIKNDKKTVRNSWIAISLTFIFAEFVSLILP
jgi:hypothetical protein